jgi:hypothetical protein
MNKQEVFNKVWNHFVVNLGPASRDSEGCFYRGPNGAKCAIGIFIADEDYSDEMEGLAIIDSNETNSYGVPGHRKLSEAVKKGIPDLNLDNQEELYFLNHLQDCHDSAGEGSGPSFHREIKKNLTNFAEEFNLEVPE